MNKTELPVGSPCSVDWAAMTQADKGRFCGDCKKVVHELSRMTEGEARELMAGAKQGELCVRYVYDRNGKVFFGGDALRADLVPPSLLIRAKRAALLAAVVAVPFAIAACGGGNVMGDFTGGDAVEPVVAENGFGDAASEAGADAKGDAHADGGTAEGGDAATDAGDAGDADPDAYVTPN